MKQRPHAENKSPTSKKKARVEQQEEPSHFKVQDKKLDSTESSSGYSWIKEINFERNIKTVKRDTGDNKSKFDIFSNAKTWSNIPPLVVITGRNGQGKSILLEYIKLLQINNNSIAKKAKKPLLKEEIVYIPSDKKFSDHVAGYSSILDFDKEGEILKQEDVIDNIIDCLKKQKPISLPEPYSLEQKIWCEAFIARIEEQIKTPKAVTKEKIITIARTVVVDNTSSETDHPISRLMAIFRSYVSQYKKNSHNIVPFTNFPALQEHYKELKPTEIEVFGLQGDFFTGLANRDFCLNLIHSYATKRIGTPPWKIINDILKDNKFKYTVKPWINHDFSYANEELILQKGNTEIKYYNLSSGEKLILNLLSWFYCIGERHNNGRDIIIHNKTKLMLLDEFDSHLDPKLIKLFLNIIQTEFVEKAKIQVIMTTHRVDTVKLAPKDSIFTLKNTNDVIEIENVHPLHAMFRMTNNIASILGYHVKVYAESTTDSRFYEGVYSTLREYCDDARKSESWNGDFESQGGEAYQWNIKSLEEDDPINFRLLSQRYQMEFLPASIQEKNSNKGNGGAGSVHKIVEQHNNAFKDTRSKFLFSDPQLNKYYGIIDRDHTPEKPNPHSVFSSVESKQVIILKIRYSIENFIFDPVIFCSVLSYEDFYSKQGPLQEHLTNFLDTCINIKNTLNQNKTINGLQEDINKYFSFLLEFKQEKTKNTNDELKKTESVKVIVNKDNFITLQYPQFIFDINGHVLENEIFNPLLSKKIADTIVNKVKSNGLDFIPEDLANVFFTLNDRIRHNVKDVFKKFTDPGSSQTTQDKKEYTTDSVISEGTNASDNMGSSDSSDTKAELRHTDQLISTEIGDIMNHDNDQDLMGCELLPPDDSILI